MTEGLFCTRAPPARRDTLPFPATQASVAHGATQTHRRTVWAAMTAVYGRTAVRRSTPFLQNHLRQMRAHRGPTRSHPDARASDARCCTTIGARHLPEAVGRRRCC